MGGWRATMASRRGRLGHGQVRSSVPTGGTPVPRPLSRIYRRLACQKSVETVDDVLEVGSITTLNFGRHEPFIADLAQRLANFRPVNVPFADVLPVKPAFAPVHLEIFYMHLDDAVAERSHPVLRVAVKHDIPDITVRFHPRQFELIQVTRNFNRAQQEL